MKIEPPDEKRESGKKNLDEQIKKTKELYDKIGRTLDGVAVTQERLKNKKWDADPLLKWLHEETEKQRRVVMELKQFLGGRRHLQEGYLRYRHDGGYQ